MKMVISQASVIQGAAPEKKLSHKIKFGISALYFSAFKKKALKKA